MSLFVFMEIPFPSIAVVPNKKEAVQKNSLLN